MEKKLIWNRRDESYQKVLVIYLTGIMILSAFFGIAKNVRTDGTGNYPPPENEDWVIGEETKIWNETREINGNITIIDYGNLTLDNVTFTINGNITIENLGMMTLHNSILKMNCSYDGQYHIEVKDGGVLNILDIDSNPLTEDFSLITDGDYDVDDNMANDFEYGFIIRNGAKFVFKNSIINECGYYVHPYEESGLYIEADDVIIDNSSISNCFAGIIAKNCNFIISNSNISNSWYGISSISSSLILKNNDFYNNTIAIYCEDSNFLVINNTFKKSHNADVFLEKYSNFTLLNFTSDNFSPYFNDENSSLIVQWYLDVKVEDTKNTLVSNAIVSVKDNEDIEIFNGKTDINGWKKGIICTEYIENRDEKIYKTPHEINVEKEGYTSNTTVVDFTEPNNHNQEITIIITELEKSQIGHSISYAGDINNDGFEDVIVGAPYDDTNDKKAGAVYIFFGYSNFEPSELDMKDANVTLYGCEAYENFGFSVSDAGDINNDNFDDIIVGAPNATFNGKRRGCAYIFFGSNSMNKTIFATEANAKFFGKKTDEKFGSSVTGVGDVNGDEYDDFLIGAVGANKAYLIYGGEILEDDKIYMANLWDDDIDGIVDFTDNINSTDNTWGVEGEDDGWDTSPIGIYGGSETEVRYNPTSGESANGVDRSIETVDELQIEIGGGSNNGGQTSGAYGVEINITQELFDKMDSAVLKFDWKLMEYGHENDEPMWIKARFGNKTQMTYLGTNQDSGADATNEILYFVGDGGTHTITGTFNEDIINLIIEPGSYYLELGGKNTKWTTSREYMVACFDDVSLTITQFGSPRALIKGENIGDNFGYSVSSAGDVNNDNYADFIIGAPDFKNYGKVYLYYGYENMGKDLTANSTIIGKEQNSKFGFSVDTAGDMNGDSYDDIIIGAPGIGKSYIYYGGYGGIDYGTIILDTTRDFNSGTADNVSIGSDEIKLGISGNIVPNGFFDYGWEQWTFTGGAKRHDTSSPNGMVNNPIGDWKVGPISGGPTAGFGSDRDTIGNDNNANRECDGKLRSADFTIPSDVDYLHLWYHWKVDSFDTWGGTDGVRLRLYDASNDNQLLTFAEHMASGNWQSWEDEDELITDISAFHGYLVYIELEIICNNGNRDKALAQIDDIYSCDSKGNPAEPSLFGNYTSKIFKTESSIIGINPTWEETLNSGNIEIKFRANSSVSWEDAQIAKNNEELIFDKPGNEVQFKAFLSTPNNETTPILHKISFEYYSNKNQTVIVGNKDDKFGYSVSCGGDINYDGYSEVIFGAPFNNANGNNAGATYVFYGEEKVGKKEILTTNEAFSIYFGESEKNYFGYSVSKAGNIDNKDMGEIIIGAPYFDNKKGNAYIIGIKEDDDVGVLLINSLIEGELVNATQNLKINATIANFGINTQVDFKVNLKITTINNQSYDYSTYIIISTDLYPGKKRFVEFNWKVPKEESYYYTIKVYTTLTGDMEPRNDEKIVSIKVRGTDFMPIDLEFIRGDGKWIFGEKKAIENQTTKIIANITNIGNIFAENINVSFFDNDNIIKYLILDNLSVSEIKTVNISWIPTKGKHEIKIEVDPNNKFIEYDENNNILTKIIYVNPNVPQKPFIFWTQVNYNWGSKEKVINAKVSVRNLRSGEIIAVNRTSDNPKGKCRFEINENKYLEGDMLEIIATNPIINEGILEKEIPEGTYFASKKIFAYSIDSLDDLNYPIHLYLMPYGIIMQTILDKMNINLGSIAIYSIFVKVAPDGNDNEIAYFELPDIPDGWTIFLSGEGVSNIGEKYKVIVGKENLEINLVVIPPNEPEEYILKTDVIVTLESFDVPKYSLTFTTYIDKTEINLSIDGSNSSYKTAEAGERVKYNVKITNKGTVADKISLVLYGNNSNWASLTKSKFTLGKVGETKTKYVEIIVDVPKTAKYNDYAKLFLYAVSKDGRISNTITTITYVRQKNRSIELSLENTESNGNWTEYLIKIENKGDFDELVNLEAFAPKKWKPMLNDTDIFLNVGDITFFSLTVNHPNDEKYWGEMDDIYVVGYFSDTIVKLILNKPPFANIALNFHNEIANTITIKSKITCDAIYSKDEDFNTLKYIWDFGDGNFSYNMSTIHRYELAGNYTIILRVEDKNGLIDITTRDIKIANYYSPTISVSYPLNESINVKDDIINIEIDDTLILDASESFDLDGYIVNYTWNFGDAKKYGELVYWNYSKVGDYEVILTVEDNLGKKNKLTIYVNVTKPKELEKEVKLTKEGIDAWLFYSIVFLILFLVVMVAIVFIKVGALSKQIDYSKINIGNYYDEPIKSKESMQSKEEKIKEEFIKED